MLSKVRGEYPFQELACPFLKPLLANAVSCFFPSWSSHKSSMTGIYLKEKEFSKFNISQEWCTLKR